MRKKNFIISKIRRTIEKTINDFGEGLKKFLFYFFPLILIKIITIIILNLCVYIINQRKFVLYWLKNKC